MATSLSSLASILPMFLILSLFLFIQIYVCLAANPLNVIDKCWRHDVNWRKHRQKLARCSVGFAGKMTNNIGEGVIRYKVTDPSDDALNPKPGTLRYGAVQSGKIWITFKRNMRIKLEKPLLISSYTTIDGRGVDVHIEDEACLVVYKGNNIIIHGLHIHHCKAQGPSTVMGPGEVIMPLGPMDGDGIRLVTASEIWIDHNTLYSCQDGLLDVTRGSTNVTISNNWFRNQDKVMLLGHDDGYIRDRGMKVTLVLNHFGPNCNQRMPRVRFGYAHVVNNLYQGWSEYAIGGSMNPSIKSESNYFIAPLYRKQVTWRKGVTEKPWSFYSVNDYFENGACFDETGKGIANPDYDNDQKFQIAAAITVKNLTSSAGALKCSRTLTC
ncbi:Pectate lyase 1 [Linum perenne]